MTKFFDPGFGDYIMVDNNIVERKMHEIVEQIKNYDDRLEIVCNADAMGISEAPFILAEVVGDQFYKVFEFWQLDESILERIYLADTKRVDVILNMEKNNQAIKDESQRRYREKMEASKDLVASIIGTQKSVYTFKNEYDEIIKVYDDRPYEVINERG